MLCIKAKFINIQFLPQEKCGLDEIEYYDYMNFVNKISSKVGTKTARDITTKLKQILCFAEDKYDLRIRIRKIKLPKVA